MRMIPSHASQKGEEMLLPLPEKRKKKREKGGGNEERLEQREWWYGGDFWSLRLHGPQVILEKEGEKEKWNENQ